VRITIDIDEDVLLAAKEHAAREHKSLGTVISELARESLRRPAASAGRRDPVHRVGRFAILPPRDEVITLAHVRMLQSAEGG
jgi:hypothetical protein